MFLGAVDCIVVLLVCLLNALQSIPPLFIPFSGKRWKDILKKKLRYRKMSAGEEDKKNEIVEEKSVLKDLYKFSIFFCENSSRKNALFHVSW